MQQSKKNEDSPGQFEELNEEVLTYAFSEQLTPSSDIPIQKKNITKTSERQKLELYKNKFEEDQFDYKALNKKGLHIQSNIGRIIPIGHVIFKSNFESGNINNAEQIGSNTYRIDLEKETNSNRLSAWFYFCVQGLKGQANFIIRGFTKSTSLYNDGMKICFRDVKQMTKWRRGGSKIAYINSVEGDEDAKTFELRFSHFFKSNEHTCIQFAYCFPYGFKKLQNLIYQIKDQIICSKIGKSFEGRDIPLLTIGNKQSQNVIVMSARVHPGQTVSSFIIEGFIKELIGDNEFGKILKANYLFKIVPMLNPDGVVKGNYRFSAAGFDLNRKWKNCKENIQPEIYKIRELIRTLNKEKKVVMYIDIHGHSRKKNVFFYGCCEQDGPINPKPKQFPFLMEKIFDAFSFQKCSFAVEKDKEGTARVAMWRQLKIDYVYTLEASFYGSQYGSNYLEADYEKVGRKLCQGIAIFFYDEMKNAHENTGFKQLEKLSLMKKKIIEELISNPILLNVGQDNDSGSDTEPQKGQIPQKQRLLETGLPKPNSLMLSNRSQIKSNQKAVINSVRSKSSTKYGVKFKSEISIQDEFKSLSQQKEIQKVLVNDSNLTKTQKIELKLIGNVNMFELDLLKSNSIHQKNVRVHSLSRNNARGFKKGSAFDIQSQWDQKESDRLKINLMHASEGAQYRRVRKIAQQSMKRDCELQEDNNIVKGLESNRMEIDRLKTIAPRFYPISQQKYRRTSVENNFKRQTKQNQIDGKRNSLHDEINVKCLGKQIYF